MSRFEGFLAELRRRNVLRAAALYAAGSWALAQGVAQLGPLFALPEWLARGFVIACIVGFPFWVAFAWLYEFTPEGLKRESEIDPADSIAHRTGRKLDFAIIGVLALAVVLLLTDRFVPRGSASAAPAVSQQSIAVLPFVNMSSDKEQDYFSDGLSEELLNQLARIPALHVAARTSSFSFKGKDLAIPDIARTLLVAHVLEGSIRKSGDQMRITAQLIRASDGYELWSKTFDRRIDDIFRIQDEIAASVVDALKVTLLGAVPKARETDPRAYALYLQAVQLGNQLTADSLPKSDALHRQVLDIDPRYVGAWVGLARNAIRATQIGMVPTADGFARGREAVAKALEIDPDYAPAQAAAGRISIYGDNDLAAGAQHLRRALAIDPVNLDSLRAASVLLSDLGRADQALALGVAILERDPIDVDAWHNRGLQELATRRYDDAGASFRTALNLTPARGEEHFMLGLSLLLKGDAIGALAQIEQESSEAWRLIGLAIAYHALGRDSESDASLATLIGKYEKDATYNVAGIYAMRGDADNAFAWLEKATGYQDPGLSEILLDSTLFNIRSDPRWLPFLRKIGRAPEQLDRIDFNVEVPRDVVTRG